MTIYRIEGIILQLKKYAEHDLILSVFTSGYGIIKLFLKGQPQQKPPSIAPLTYAEFVYRENKSDLHSCNEVSPINTHPELRKNSNVLEAALDLVKALIDSQLDCKPAPDLYSLFLSYLEKLPSIPDPRTLAMSFRLKILQHEGLLLIDSYCAACGTPLTEHYMRGSESYCIQHASPHFCIFSSDEVLLLKKLAFTRSFKELFSIKIPLDFTKKVCQIFVQSLE
jgi:DNA repair protein RecO (recombination protein O)